MKQTMHSAQCTNNYLYNGNELQNFTNYYAYGFRQQDPQLGRWHAVDKLAEWDLSASPYSYASNNPINNVDLYGLAPSHGNYDWNLDVAQGEAIMNLWNITHGTGRGTNMSGGSGGTFAGHGAGISGYGYSKHRNSGGSAFMARPPDDPPGPVWVYFTGASVQGGLVAGAAFYYQTGYANDDYGTTFFKFKGGKVLNPGSREFYFLGDIDLWEGGFVRYKGKDFDSYINSETPFVVSVFPIDFTWFPSNSFGVSGGASISLVSFSKYAQQKNDLISYSISKSEYQRITRDIGFDINVDDFRIKNPYYTFDMDGNIVAQTADLYVNYYGKEIDLGIKVKAGADNIWKSVNYINSQNMQGASVIMRLHK